MPIVIECVFNLCIKKFYNILKGISIFRSAVHLFDKKIILNGKTFQILLKIHINSSYTEALGILDAHNLIWK